jgi:hypothetical protein
MNLEALKAHFPREAISWRAQSVTKDGTKAMALAYIDARDVMNRLDEVCGPEGWQDEYIETPKGRMICRIGIDLRDLGWVWKSDGAGDTDVEGDKGAISDAFKRAAVKWGIGRYLYDMPNPWVPCETFNGKWKSWKEDPWKYVKAPPAPAQPAAKFIPLPPELEPFKFEFDDIWEEAAVQKLSPAELENPEVVAQAFAELIRSEAESYKTVKGVDNYMGYRKRQMEFIERYAPHIHSAIRSAVIIHRTELKAAKEAAQ